MSDQRTPVPDRVDLDFIQELIDKRRKGGYQHTYIDNGVLVSVLTEARLFRNKYDASHRRQKDAARAQRNARERWQRPNSDD